MYTYADREVQYALQSIHYHSAVLTYQLFKVRFDNDKDPTSQSRSRDKTGTYQREQVRSIFFNNALKR